MRVLDAVVLLASIAAAHGNVKMFIGDMRPVTKHHFDVGEPVTECPKERKKLGKKYLQIYSC